MFQRNVSFTRLAADIYRCRIDSPTKSRKRGEEKRKGNTRDFPRANNTLSANNPNHSTYVLRKKKRRDDESESIPSPRHSSWLGARSHASSVPLRGSRRASELASCRRSCLSVSRPDPLDPRFDSGRSRDAADQRDSLSPPP